MRFGYSQPLGHGRRAWVSMPWPLQAVYVWFWLAWVAVVMAAWLVLAAAGGTVELYRWYRARRAPQWAKRPLR